MRKALVSALIACMAAMVWLGSLFGPEIPAANAAGTKISLNASMVVNESSVGDPTLLVNEQSAAGDPLGGTGGAPNQSWFGGYNASSYPLYAYIDLGQSYDLTHVYLRDVNDIGDFKVFAGSPSTSWTLLFTDDLGSYNAWKPHAVSVTTRYVRLSMASKTSNMSEIVLYGTPSAGADTTAPAAVSDLAATSSSFNSIDLAWTAPGNDGTNGTAVAYDLRYSISPITGANWANATQAIGEPSPQVAGSAQSMTIGGLSVATTYYFALKTSDGAANTSALSNVASRDTLPVATGDDTATVTLQFDSAASAASVHKAVLKYNKDFAYSFTQDDTPESGYSMMYKLLHGGTLKDGTTSNGLFYTDGAGNNVAFKAGVAINGNSVVANANSSIYDAYLSWSKVQQLFDAGWDILNHSFQHATGLGSAAAYTSQVTQNTSIVQNNIGFEMTHFVVPTGDKNYYQPALDNGNVALYDQAYELPGFNGGLKVDAALAAGPFKLYRNSVTSLNTAKIDAAAASSVNGNHYWINDFTHDIAVQNWGGGMTPAAFRGLMEYVANTYGSGGSDRVWMAPLQEVYEYLKVRDAVTVTSSLSGNTLQITLDLSAVPAGLRRHALTLTVNASTSFSNVQVTGATLRSFNGTNATNKLINLEW
ncbi:hypothetical protein [Cohnella sp. GCM10027633]|uniref:hypothetical protein n=1 Tax=unclassified Cohnella TaxID=2636738 RepID=UPI00362FAD98